MKHNSLPVPNFVRLPQRAKFIPKIPNFCDHSTATGNW